MHLTLSIFLVCVSLTLYVSFAAMVPEARIFALIVPCVTCCVATSGREAFMMVLEKKVSTSKTARKMMATVLTHSRLFTFVSIVPYPFTEPAYVMPSTR